MLITILGFWDENKVNEWSLQGSHAAFAKACEDIGKELGKRQQAVIVGNDSPNAADYHIVKGMVENAGNEISSYRLINVIRPADGSYSFQDFWKSRPDLFTSHARVQHRKEGAKFISVQEADAVLTIGGTETTYHVGLAAILAKKTLVPIASFGGASRQLLNALEEYGKLKNHREFGPLNGPWTPDVMETALRLTGIMTLPKLLIIHGRGNDCLLLRDWLFKDTEFVNVSIMKERIQIGHTLPEKFEELAGDVDAAIALATPDDIGGFNTEVNTNYKPRARQNVWLEVGWFWGRLGRNKIMVLSKGDVEIPTDLQGVELYSYEDKPYERDREILSFLRSI